MFLFQLALGSFEVVLGVLVESVVLVRCSYSGNEDILLSDDLRNHILSTTLFPFGNPFDNVQAYDNSCILLLLWLLDWDAWLAERQRLWLGFLALLS